MYLSEGGDFSEPTIVQSPSESSGLYIRTRGGELTKVSIPEDSLAFQTGEALEIATGGKLRATPHWSVLSLCSFVFLLTASKCAGRVWGR